MTDPVEEVLAAAVEAGARAYYEWATCNAGEVSRWDETDDGDSHQRFARARAEVIIAAALPELRKVMVEPDRLEQVGWLCHNTVGLPEHPWLADLNERLAANVAREPVYVERIVGEDSP